MSMSTIQLDRLNTGRSLTRRAVLGKALGLGAAVAAGAVASRPMLAAASETGYYRTTTALNLRSGPGTGYGVVLVMPGNAMVRSLGETRNGFRKVSYLGTPGWAHQDYLTVTNGGSTDSPVIVGSTRTTATVNLRSGPSTSHSVLRVVAAGTWVEISNTVQNGFRYVVHQGLAGWIYDQYLSQSGETPYDPNSATTTSALNLRAEPSLSAKILTVMPSGARVKLLDGYSNGFRKVSYNGLTGWASTAYLN